MKSTTQILLELWQEGRTRFTNQLPLLTEEALKKRLLPSLNSVGFLISHIGDVELLFIQNVFGVTDVKVIAKTVIAQKDTGEWTNLHELLKYFDFSFNSLKAMVEEQTNADWETNHCHQRIWYKDKS
ncbi:DinB family protein [Roseivirga echinicomitans]|uniref:DinB family protein n=1 Tax=Roseivirga echinicomitans TaxID=296218 RepID=UPI000ACA61D3|nr:DinB family protein [Roseivirga echinicomitans]